METIGHTIQLAVAPVFLLTGVGPLLTTRLGRIIDRARGIDAMLPTASAELLLELREEFLLLGRRASLINRAIALGVVAALSICLVVAALFIGYALGVALLGTVVAGLFVLSMLALIAALILLLLEVRLTTRLVEERLLEWRGTRSKHS